MTTNQALKRRLEGVLGVEKMINTFKKLRRKKMLTYLLNKD